MVGGYLIDYAVVLETVRNDLYFWTAIPGIVIECTTGIVIVIIICMGLLYKKLHTLDMYVLSLQAVNSRIESAQAQDKLSLNYLRNSDPSSPLMANGTTIYETVITTTVQIGPYLVATLIAITCLLVLYRKFSTYCTVKMMSKFNSEIWLEINDGDKSVIVYLETIHGLPGDFTLVAKHYMKIVEVAGFCKPLIVLNWKSLRFINIHTGKSVKLQDTYSISFWNAMRLRRLIGRPYVCLPVMVFNNCFYRLPVKESIEGPVWAKENINVLGLIDKNKIIL